MKFSKQLKYGSVSILLTVIFIAFAVVLNVVLSLLNVNGKLDIDLTGDSMYTISDASKALLSENDTDITVYFLQERDKIKDDAQGTGYMLHLVDSYADSFDWVNVEFIDLAKNPKFKNAYTKSSNDKLASSSVIIECKATGEYRVLTYSDYFLLEEDTSSTESMYYKLLGQTFYIPVGFQGELALTSGMLNILNPDGLVAYCTMNHNEDESDVLNSFLKEVGYEIKNISLDSDDFADDASLVVINNPKNDFGGIKPDVAATSEIEKLAAYMAKPGKNMLVFMSPDTPELYEFDQFLATYGVEVERSTVVDNDNSAAGTDGMMVYGNYNVSVEDSAAAQSIADAMKSVKNNSVFYRAAPIKTLFEYKNNLVVSSVVTTSKAASVGGNGTKEQLNLMTVTTAESSEGSSNLVLFSTPYFNTFITNTHYANRDIMYSVAKLFGVKDVAADVAIKQFDDTTMNISSNNAKVWGVVITVVPAFIIALAGMIVWIKRRHL